MSPMFAPNDSDLKQIDDYINSHVVVSRDTVVTSNTISLLRDSFHEIAALFKKHPIENYHYLWIANLTSLSQQLLLVKSVLTNPLFKSQVNQMTSELVEMNQWLMNGYVRSDSSICQWIHVNLQLILIDIDELLASLDKPLSYIKKLAMFMKKNYSQSKFSFSCLVKLIKICYITDLVEELIPFFEDGDIEPMTPLKQTVEYSDLIDFYRYTAFCLVSPRIRQNRAPFSAATYFKTLFLFPSLSLDNFNDKETRKSFGGYNGNNISSSGSRSSSFGSNTKSTSTSNLTGASLASQELETLQEDGDSASKILLSIKERQEISLLYILDSLLSLSSMNQLINCKSLFKKEQAFLIESLSRTIREDMLSSVSENKSSSSVSISSLGNNAPEENYVSLRSRCISSILYLGSYNEILTLVIQFLKNIHKTKFIIKTYLEGEHSLKEKMRPNLNPLYTIRRYQYLDIVHIIAQLIEYYSFKFWITNTRICSVPIYALSKDFGWSLDSLLKNSWVKNWCEIVEERGEVSFKVEEKQILDIDEEVKLQIKALETIKALNTVFSR